MFFTFQFYHIWVFVISVCVGWNIKVIHFVHNPRAFTLSDLVHEQTESPPVMLRKIKTNAELSFQPKNCDRWIVPN